MIHEALQPLAFPVEKLSPLPGNPRKGDVDAVARSYATFGQRKPIVARREGEGGIVIAGNHQLEAAKRLGWEEIAVVFTDDDDLTAKAYALADNKTADLGTYDDDLIAEILAELVVDDELLAATAFSEREIARLLGETAGLGQTDVDDTPTPPRVAKTVEGDIWLLGPHRLICGDSTDPDIVAKALGGKPADAIFTDPPYNVAYQGGTDEKLTIANDSMSDLEFASFLLAAYGAMYANAREGAPIYVCHAESAGQDFRVQLTASGFLLKQVLIWVKDQFVLSRQDYNWQHEPILYGWKPGAAHPWYGPFNDSTVQDTETKDLRALTKPQLIDIIGKARDTSTIVREPRPRRNDDHPTMKPVGLIRRLLKNSCKAGDLVLDPFGGSGSTLIAAHGLEMQAALVELDPIYADVICRRYQEHTGILPINEATGNPHDFTKVK